MLKRSLVILGSTGSIGTQALELVDLYPEHYAVSALCAHSNHALLFEQVRKYRPLLAGITGGEVAVPEDLQFCQWHFGPQALETLAKEAPCDDVLVSVVGMVGLTAVLAALKAGRRVLLANKEALVSGGAQVMDLCTLWGQKPSLIPVDSEHSAIYQCLQGAADNPVDHILLTASGGPFRTWSKEQLQHASIADALRHPNWKMGRKISIDSATMFNKALEVVEAKWLFDLKPSQIRVLVHPQSIVHSMVAYQDGTVIAQMGHPDMRAPIAYAMAYPRRLPGASKPLLPVDWGTLTFEQADEKRFPALGLVRQALAAGGAACCILNAANEVAVAAFLAEQISFLQIAAVVEETLQQTGSLPASTLPDVLFADDLARKTSKKLITYITTEET